MPVHLAAQNGHLNILGILEEAGADLSVVRLSQTSGPGVRRRIASATREAERAAAAKAATAATDTTVAKTTPDKGIHTEDAGSNLSGVVLATGDTQPSGGRARKSKQRRSNHSRQRPPACTASATLRTADVGAAAAAAAAASRATARRGGSTSAAAVGDPRPMPAGGSGSPGHAACSGDKLSRRHRMALRRAEADEADLPGSGAGAMRGAARPAAFGHEPESVCRPRGVGFAALAGSSDGGDEEDEGSS